MLPQKQAEEAIVSQSIDHEDRDEEIPDHHQTGFSLGNFLWHGGSVYDAWFSCASNQVAQVLLTLPYSLSTCCIFQVFYGILGSWTADIISILYVEYRSRKEKENVNFKNHVIQWC